MEITLMDDLIYIALIYMIISDVIRFIIIKRKTLSKILKHIFIIIGIVMEASLIYSYIKEPELTTLCLIMMCAVDILAWTDFYINKMIKNSKK